MSKNLAVIGFVDEQSLVEQITTLLQTTAQYATVGSFAAGELQVTGRLHVTETTIIATSIHAPPESLWRACFLSELVRAAGAKRVILVSPWIAYGRQDRITEMNAAPGGLLVARWLREAFDQIYTFDAHSQRFIDAFNGKLRNLHGSPLLYPSLLHATVVVAPDRGAEARAQAAGALLNLPVAVLTKTRIEQQVTITLPENHVGDWAAETPLLVDDMTDSGGTLITAAKTLKDAGAKEILAFIPHVLRGSVLRSRAEGVINRVETVFDHETATYVPEQLSLLTTQLQRDQESLEA